MYCERFGMIFWASFYVRFSKGKLQATVQNGGRAARSRKKISYIKVDAYFIV
jgi:hypothetical protein